MARVFRILRNAVQRLDLHQIVSIQIVGNEFVHGLPRGVQGTVHPDNESLRIYIPLFELLLEFLGFRHVCMTRLL